jgi:hypothetical protein
MKELLMMLENLSKDINILAQSIFNFFKRG